MNPWAFLLVLIAFALFIVSYKGTQDNVISAVLGRHYGNSTLGGQPSSKASANANPTTNGITSI
ncbi:MAG: hypothetical protein ACREHG_03755 [Candidatus Saccharimonadales bacterium]